MNCLFFRLRRQKFTKLTEPLIGNFGNVVQMKATLSLLPLAVALAPFAYAQTTYTFVSVDYPGAAYTQLNGINSSGAIVGVYSPTVAGNTAYCFARTKEGEFEQLISYPAYVAGISDSRIVVGSALNKGFLLKDRRIKYVSSSKFITNLTGISSTDQVVGNFFDGFQEYYGFKTVGGESVELPYYENEPVRPQGINSAGTIVGIPEAESALSFILPVGGTYQIVQYPGAIFGTQLSAINDAGVSAGVEYTTSASGQGFTYDGSAFSDVVFPGSTNTTPLGVNNSGVVVGLYVDAGSVTHGFIATPVE